MRALLSTLLLPLLFATTVIGGFDVHEMEKIGSVWHHYMHHVQDHEGADLTFVTFLVDHFAPTTEKDSEHQDMPLIGGGHHCMSQSVPTSAQNSVLPVVPVVSVFFVPEDAAMQGAPPVQRLFQPPRIS